MKTYRYFGMLMTAVGLIGAASCSDFDDYNTVPTDVTTSANRTLWENISRNSELSDFAALVKKAGFDDELQASHYYTVWAPKNGTYNAAALMQKGNGVVLREFVKNHIAEYNHTVSGEVSERIHTLNDKSYDFIGHGTYTFDNITVSTPNLPSTNGVMHVLDGMATFYPNIYEYLDMAEGIDSLKKYIKTYELTTLDTKRSVVGPTVNGRQTYIDSVMVTSNTMTRLLRAYIEREDSSYTMMMPSNEAWVAAYNRIKPYYNYIATISAEDIRYDGVGSAPNKQPTITATVNQKYMTDSLTKLSLASCLIFNNNDVYNQWVESAGVKSTDTIYTTGNATLANPAEYLAATKQKVRMSNGFVRFVDSLAVRPWDSWAPMMTSSTVGHTWTGTMTIRRMNLTRPGQADTTVIYRHAAPTNNFSKPQVDMMLPNVLSTAYNIYLVLVPPYDEVGKNLPTLAEAKPNQLDFSLSYCKADGKLAVQKLNQKVENDPTRIDTVFVGTFKFPVCYRNLSNSNIVPNLKITTDFNVFNKVAMAKYTRDIRIAMVIMKPVELDEFETNN